MGWSHNRWLNRACPGNIGFITDTTTAMDMPPLKPVMATQSYALTVPGRVYDIYERELLWIWRFSFLGSTKKYAYEPGLPSSSFHLSGPSNSHTGHTQFFSSKWLGASKVPGVLLPKLWWSRGWFGGGLRRCSFGILWSKLGCPKRMVFWIQIYRLRLQRGLEARVGTVVFFNRGHRIHSAGWCGLLLAPSCLRLGI